MLTRVMLFIINTLYPRANLNLQLLIYFHGLGFWFWYFLFYYCMLFTLPVFVVFPPVLFCRRCSSLVCLVFCSFPVLLSYFCFCWFQLYWIKPHLLFFNLSASVPLCFGFFLSWTQCWHDISCYFDIVANSRYRAAWWFLVPSVFNLMNTSATFALF